MKPTDCINYLILIIYTNHRSLQTNVKGKLLKKNLTFIFII